MELPTHEIIELEKLENERDKEFFKSTGPTNTSPSQPMRLTTGNLHSTRRDPNSKQRVIVGKRTRKRDRAARRTAFGANLRATLVALALSVFGGSTFFYIRKNT